MTLLVPLTMIGWVPLTFLLFHLFSVRRAVALCLVFGWLMLPMAEYRLPGIPDYNKAFAVHVTLFVACCYFDADRIRNLTLSWIDAPILIWLSVPFLSSMSNNLGIYDGVATSLDYGFRWGLPYFFGRTYLCDREGLRELALAILLGGLAYVPLILYEVRMSPQLHNQLFGFMQHTFQQVIRFGGWRPMVFLRHGLVLSLWISAGSAFAFWLWRRRADLPHVGPYIGWITLLFVVTTIACRSLNGILLMFGAITLASIRGRVLQQLCLVLVLLVPTSYVVTRLMDVFPTTFLVESITTYVNPDRAQSVDFRWQNEDILIEKAMERPLLGWGGWGRAEGEGLIKDQMTTSDGFWIIQLGTGGLIGLFGFLAVHILPLLVFIQRATPRWESTEAAIGLGLCLIVGLTFIDNMLNHNEVPAFIATIGALSAMQVSEAPETQAPIDVRPEVRFI